MFGGTSTFGGQSLFSGSTTAVANHNPMKDIEVTQPPDDSISSMAFSPGTLSSTFLAAGSWDNNVRCWEVQQSGTVIPKAMQTHAGPVLDIAWSDDGSKIFTASADKTAKVWDLNSNQSMQVAQHDAPVKTVHWIKSSSYCCLMTGSWDKTLKFWDTRTPNPILTMQLGERVYCADVLFPMAVVGTANRGIIIYQLDNAPQEFKRMESPLKYQHRCVSIFVDRKANATNPPPVGFALGSIEGRVAIQYVNPQNPKDNFTFKCHRSNGTTGGPQDIYAVNCIEFHPTHGTLATVGSDGRFSFWDKDARTKLKTSEQLDQPISSCCFNATGNVFAYSSSYDWSKGHEGFDAQKMKPHIFLRSCFEELKQSQKKP
jgi:mRNA export factor